MTHDLDGTYQVTSTTNYQGPLEKKSDGVTEIRDGKTSRYDDANCLWTSHFKVVNDAEVEMISIADPKDANVDFLLVGLDGAPTRDPVTYTATLKLMRKGDKVQMSGQVQYGDEIIFLTMRKAKSPE